MKIKKILQAQGMAKQNKEYKIRQSVQYCKVQNVGGGLAKAQAFAGWLLCGFFIIFITYNAINNFKCNSCPVAR